MTPKQKVFVHEYLVDLNATQASIRSGYSRRTAAKIGEENLRKPDIARAIEAAMAERALRTEITADRVLQEVAKLAFFDIRKAFNPDGTMKRLDQMDGDTAAALAGLEVTEERNAQGEPTGIVRKLKLADKTASLTLLMRHLGMLNDKLKVQGDADNPLAMLIKSCQGSALKPVTHPLADDGYATVQ